MSDTPFLLASASPRRKELLSNVGYSFQVVASDADESLDEKLSAKEATLILAKRKAFSVAEKNPNSVVLGCDTVVALENKILGKPKTKEEAFEMLSCLSGRVHTVYTGVCIIGKGKSQSFVCETEVEFYPLSSDTISSYIATGEPMDKAGAYGIQGFGSALVKRINGDYFSVVGLPLSECMRHLSEFGVTGKLEF